MRGTDKNLIFIYLDTHIIPVLEDKLHALSEDCECRPVKDVDENGHVTWIHINLMNDHLIDRLDVL
jgi:hypothetical protein